MPDRNAAADELARRLKGVKIAAGLKSVALEAATGISRQKISRVEHGHRLPNADEVRVWCEACGKPDQGDALVELLASAKQADTAWVDAIQGGQDRVQQGYAALAAASTEIAYVDPMYIPGPLQTVEYATEILARSEAFHRKGGANKGTVERAVAARLSIAAMFGDPAKQFTFVTSEAALTVFRYLPDPLMVEQLRHLRSFAQMPSVWFGIVAAGHIKNITIPPGFQRFDDQLRIDTAGEVLRRSASKKFDQYLRRLDAVKALAVTGSDAVGLVDAAIDRLDSTP